jgi:hypothetical protein
MADEKEKLTDQEIGDVSEVDESKDGDVNKDAELDKMIQSKVDKTAAKIKGQYEKKIAELESKLEQEKTAKMSEEERIQHLSKQQEEERQQFERERLKFELSRKLMSAELPSELTELLLNPPQSKEELDDKLNEVLSVFETYKARVLKDFRVDNTRKPEGAKGAGGVDFSKMGIDELTTYARTSDKARAAVADYLNKR